LEIDFEKEFSIEFNDWISKVYQDQGHSVSEEDGLYRNCSEEIDKITWRDNDIAETREELKKFYLNQGN